MTPHEQFWLACQTAARAAGHKDPEMAACEAALESAWGTSGLARADNNLFGMKQHRHPIYGTHVLPTREFLDGKWVPESCAFVHYPSWRECFLDRMATLQRLASVYPHYAAALAAPTPEAYITEVSKTWSTDPRRAQKVLDIYHAVLGAAPCITPSSPSSASLPPSPPASCSPSASSTT